MAVHQGVRKRFRVHGVVQGVGFRPFVHGLATRLRLYGFVLNDSTGVLIEVEGRPHEIAAFRDALRKQPPPLAHIERIEEEDVLPAGDSSFHIRRSEHAATRATPISADVATCDACVRELADPSERRYRYPFTNCTDCGPRFTITTDVPYDRPNTTMAGFAMCAACNAEYENPADRRFHAQPIACPRCGPQLRLTDAGGRTIGRDPIEESVRLLRDGAIVAIKGLGGYHLACDAAHEEAVGALRARKAREEKPFAVMAPSTEWAAELVDLSDHERDVLTSHRRPIVLAIRRADAPVADAVAPQNRYLGVMLPYAPVHHLLLADLARPIVLTSGNVSDEPIAYRDDDAQERLAGIADAWLMHDRAINVRCDDSVVRVLGGRVYPIRRSRGYAPEPLTVDPGFVRPVLAAGPELKHTFCLGRGEHAILSHHIGDLENWETMSAFTDAVSHFTRIFDVDPEVVAHDLHPEYLSTKWATSLHDVQKVPVQHHHAHIASCLADNRRSESVIGLALDGTGYGDDAAIWGCEVLVCDLKGYERVAHLRYVPLPGGAAAIKEPWRMAAVYLDSALGADAAQLDLDFVRRTHERWEPVLQMTRKGVNSPLTSSAGRLFDAAAALCGVRERVTYEGQAAAELEQLADPCVTATYPCSVSDGSIDGVELIAALAADLAAGRPRADAAARFHNGLAEALVTACERARGRSGLEAVALSGGTWQNLFLLERVRRQLVARRFDVLLHRRVPPNDGGISLGQAVVANAVLFS